MPRKQRFKPSRKPKVETTANDEGIGKAIQTVEVASPSPTAWQEPRRLQAVILDDGE